MVYTQDHIDILNEFGALTTALLARKYGISFTSARKILMTIADDHSNLLFCPPDYLCIEGRDIRKDTEPYKPKSKRKKAHKKKISPWKNVTRP